MAEPAARRRGLGTEAVQLLLGYAAERCAVRRFYCKIGDANAASIAMFKRLGFVVCNHVAAFEETELELLVPGTAATATNVGEPADAGAAPEADAAAAAAGVGKTAPFQEMFDRASVHTGVVFEPLATMGGGEA